MLLPPATVRPATGADVAALAALAALTFPLAAPDDTTEASIADFVATHLSPERFTGYLADPARDLLVADADGALLGYAMLVTGDPTDADVDAALTRRPTIELSKFYVAPDAHGSGVASALMTAVLEVADQQGAAGTWLGVNQENARAQRFYGKHGFEQVGTKRFLVGDRLEHDFVLERALR